MTDTQSPRISGWDIGGANLKAVALNGERLQVVQEAFAVWQRRDALATTLAAMSDQLGLTDQAAITITAELSDAFRTKREGIAFVLDAVQVALPKTTIHVFGLDGGFHAPAKAVAQPLLVAAANWLATALMVARRYPTCLLVDIGSTTTDVIPIVDGQVVAEGHTDPERLVRGELLYTGVLRTPIFGIVQQVPLWGRWCPVAAELFATAQDVHLLLGHLSEDQCTSPSADGRPVTAEYAAERLARVVCADVEMLRPAEIRALAAYMSAAQTQQVAAAIAQVASRRNHAGPIVAVGIGQWLIKAAADQIGVACVTPLDLLDEAGLAVAPAAAVARLLQAQASSGA